MESLQYKYEFMWGFRRNSKLLVLTDSNQIFKQKHVYKEHIRYICYFDNCHVTVALKNNGVCEQLSQDYHHSHAPPVDLVKKFKMLGKIKSGCTNETALKRKGVRAIFDEECRQDRELAEMVSFPKMRRQLHRIHNSRMPKNPNTPEDIKLIFEDSEFCAEYGNSKHIDEPFYRETIIEEGFSYSVFISPSIAAVIQKKPEDRRYLVDGTFKTVPSCGQKQLLIIHFYYMDHTFPFIYVLMTKKTREAYVHMFQFINTNFFQFKASAFHTDYEKSLTKALEIVFPTAALKGCWFHYCQALRRKTQTIKRFGSFIKSNEDCRKWYRKFLTLPLVSPEQIEEMFLHLKNDLGEFSRDQRECLNVFVMYFERQWMKQITPSRFSVYLEPIRTTSALEGFNSKLSKKLEKHGRFFKFLQVIRDEDFAYSVSLAQASAGVLNVLPKKRKPQSDKDRRIHQLSQRLSKGDISLADFFNIIINTENNILEANDIIEEDGEQDVSDVEDTEDDSEIHLRQGIEVLSCIICIENPRTILLQPCKHFKICSGCFEKLELKSKTNKSPLLCPYCRRIVEGNLHIFQ